MEEEEDKKRKKKKEEEEEEEEGVNLKVVLKQNRTKEIV